MSETAHNLNAPRPAEWRCSHCNKLLGVPRGARVHLRFSRGHEYFAGYPVTATCRGCGTLNELARPDGPPDARR